MSPSSRWIAGAVVLVFASAALSYIWALEGANPRRTGVESQTTSPSSSVSERIWRDAYPMPSLDAVRKPTSGPQAPEISTGPRVGSPSRTTSGVAADLPEPVEPVQPGVLTRMWGLPSTTPQNASQLSSATVQWRVVGTVARGSSTSALLMLDNDPTVREFPVGAQLPNKAGQIRWISTSAIGIVLPDGRAVRMRTAVDFTDSNPTAVRSTGR